MLVNIIINDDYSFELKYIICKLLIILWLDTYSLNRILIPSPICIWSQLGPDNNYELPVYDNPYDSLRPLISYLQDQLIKEVIEDITLMKSNLELIYSLLQLGLFNDLNTLISLTIYIKKFIYTVLQDKIQYLYQD